MDNAEYLVVVVVLGIIVVEVVIVVVLVVVIVVIVVFVVKPLNRYPRNDPWNSILTKITKQQ